MLTLVTAKIRRESFAEKQSASISCASPIRYSRRERVTYSVSRPVEWRQLKPAAAIAWRVMVREVCSWIHILTFCEVLQRCNILDRR